MLEKVQRRRGNGDGGVEGGGGDFPVLQPPGQLGRWPVA